MADAAALQGLRKSFFGVQVLYDVGFALQRGQVLGLVGENGSGKSTTMNILGGVHQPDAGRDDARRPALRAARAHGRGRARHRVHPPGAQPLQAT